jgi:cell division GTPase FtsZ
LNKIDEVIKNHNDNYKEYINKNREIIKRYTKENQTLVDQYKELVENVLNNKFERKKYNWQENKIY